MTFRYQIGLAGHFNTHRAKLNVTSALPPSLRHINALSFDGTDTSSLRLVSLILENLRLLRAERRLFIS
jgi:hypothetical protein